MTDGNIEIRSFRVVFDLERRIHRVDRWRLPLPYGLPLRSIAYAMGALAAVLAASRVPLFGAVLGLLPAPARLALLPIAFACVMTRLQVDGRSAHAAAISRLQHAVTPRRLHAWRRAPKVGDIDRLADVVIAPDGRSPGLRPGTVRGPATVVARYPVRMSRRFRILRIEQTSHVPEIDGTCVRVGAGRRLRVR